MVKLYGNGQYSFIFHQSSEGRSLGFASFLFQKNAPVFLTGYNHTNYARWGTVYLAEMNRLPEEIYDEFMNGNFVVKESNQSFNQVDPDHSQEWLNAIGEKVVA